MRDLLVYVLFRAFSLLCRALGSIRNGAGAAALGCLIGLALGALDRRRGRVLRHMAVAVGMRRALALLPKYYEHLGLLAVEYAQLQAYHPQRVGDWMEPEGLADFREILGRGKGVILVTGHIGNWEIGGQALVSWGVPMHALFRPLKNQHLDRHLRGLRQRSGMTVYGKFDSVRAMMRVLRSGEALALILDQDGSGLGVFAPFFGKLASTLPTAARLARRTGAAIVPVTTYRLPARTKHRLKVGREIETADTGDEERDVLITTCRCNRALEEAILEHPAQWLWRHRRWQSRLTPEAVRAWREAEPYCRNT